MVLCSELAKASSNSSIISDKYSTNFKKNIFYILKENGSLQWCCQSRNDQHLQHTNSRTNSLIFSDKYCKMFRQVNLIFKKKHKISAVLAKLTEMSSLFIIIHFHTPQGLVSEKFKDPLNYEFFSHSFILSNIFWV